MKRLVGVRLFDGRLDVLEEEIPELREHQVLIEVHASLISPGTEMAPVRKLRAEPGKPDDAPAKFGYSCAGIIVETRGDCKDLRPGMRVAGMGAGYALHANYAAVPVNLVVPIPENVSFEQASSLSLAATALQAVRRTDVKLGEYGAVLGMGLVGNFAAQLGRISGGRVIGWETIPLRRRIAAQCGIDTVDFVNADPVEATKNFAAPYGLDFAVFAFGGDAEKAFDNIKKCMKVSADGHIMGTATLVGGCRVPVGGGAATGNLDIRVSSRTGAGYHDGAWEFGRDYPEAFVQFTTLRNAAELVRLISEKRLLVEPLLTHRLPLEKFCDAGDLLVEHPEQALGVVMTMKH